MSQKPLNEFETHKKFENALKNIERTANPSKDLWPEIESKLLPRETKTYIPKWMSVAIAATLVVSFCALFLSYNHLQQAQDLLNQQSTLADQATTKDDPRQNITAQIETMEQAYGLAKSALLTQINTNASGHDLAILNEIESNLIIIDQATSELKQAIDKQPNNPRLPKLLKATYQQELVVLSQLAKLNLNG